MIVSGFGVKLVRLTEKDIELVRGWRNSPEIRGNMMFREYITPEMQKEWFRSIDNISNFYYIIHYRRKKVGLVNSKKVNWEERTSEGGVFIWEEKYKNTSVPILATLCIIESGFYFLNWKKVFITVLKENKTAISFAYSLGYELCSVQENNESLRYFLTKENYLKKAGRLREAIMKFYTTTPLFSALLEAHDYTSEFGIKMEYELLNCHPDFKIKNTSKGKCFYLKVKDFH